MASKNERAAAKAGITLKAYKAGRSTQVLSGTQAKKAASSSVSKDSKALAKAQKEYIKSLTPSSEEVAATTSLGKINQQAETERANITDPTKNTVAAHFVQNQVSALSDKTENAIIPLKYQIAALQSQREAKGNIARTKLSFAKTPSTKTVDPLDQEYKQLRNEKMKKGKSESAATSLAKSNAEYNKRRTNDAQMGLVTLPKGQVGPPAPKVLIQQNAKNNKPSAKDKLKSALLKR